MRQYGHSVQQQTRKYFRSSSLSRGSCCAALPSYELQPLHYNPQLATRSEAESDYEDIINDLHRPPTTDHRNRKVKSKTKQTTTSQISFSLSNRFVVESKKTYFTYVLPTSPLRDTWVTPTAARIGPAEVPSQRIHKSVEIEKVETGLLIVSLKVFAAQLPPFLFCCGVVASSNQQPQNSVFLQTLACFSQRPWRYWS